MISNDLTYKTKADFTADQWHMRGVHLEQDGYRALSAKGVAEKAFHDANRVAQLAFLGTIPLLALIIILNPALAVALSASLAMLGVDIVLLLRQSAMRNRYIQASSAELDTQFAYQLHFAADALDTPHKEVKALECGEVVEIPKALEGGPTGLSKIQLLKEDNATLCKNNDKLRTEIKVLQEVNRELVRASESAPKERKKISSTSHNQKLRTFDEKFYTRHGKYITDNGLFYTDVPIPKPDVVIQDGFGKTIKGVYESAIQVMCTDCGRKWYPTIESRVRDIMTLHTTETGTHAYYELVRT